jgi:hypothetical protein
LSRWTSAEIFYGDICILKKILWVKLADLSNPKTIKPFV